MNKTFQIQAGFTLVELIVSVSIFIIVIFVAVGALLTLAHINDKSQALLVALENLDFGLENMSRTIRTGYGYTCVPNGEGVEPHPNPVGTDCSIGKSVHFIDADKNKVLYKLDENYWGDIDPKWNGIGAVVRVRELDGQSCGSSCPEIAITSNEIDIESLGFIVTGSKPERSGDPTHMQPRVILLIKGETKISGLKPDEQANFDIQTTMTQRKPDELPF